MHAGNIPSVEKQQRNGRSHPGACGPWRPRGAAPQSYLGGLGPSDPELRRSPWTQPPGRDPAVSFASSLPFSPSTGAERKVGPFAKYAKKEGR